MGRNFENRVRGCLTGAAAATELGLQRILAADPRIEAARAESALTMSIGWRTAPPPHPKRVSFCSLMPFVASVARAYLARGDRIVPEDWAQEIVKDPALTENPAFWLLDIHSTIELLREGMPARVSGLGAMPSGNACAATVPVGIYHAGDGEGAYLDAVEIASVFQRGPGVDWAALTAAAVAEALRPDATASDVVERTLRIAHRHARDTFYEVNHIVRKAIGPIKAAGEGVARSDFLQWMATVNPTERHAWVGHNPIGWALALISLFAEEPERAVTVSVALDAYPSIRPLVVGALAGALHGDAGFPDGWRKGVKAAVDPLVALAGVTRKKLAREQTVIAEITELGRLRRGEESVLYDKVLGCILAGAIGNAMGSVCEGQHYDEIDKKHPGGVKTILDPARLEGEDDNQMAMLLTETYIERDGYPASARDFGETWKRKLNRDHFFYCMKNSLDLIRDGMDARVAGAWNVVTGSTAMCMEPVGTYYLCDPANAYIDATAISYMYQRGLDVTAAAILAASVAEAFRPTATVDSVLSAALAAAPRTKMSTFDSRRIDTPYAYISLCLDVAAKYTDVLEARKELYEKCLYYHMIDPLEYLGLSYAMFKIAKGDVRNSAIGGTNIGRDSDTISGRSAMLSGTLAGSAGIPKEWIAMFRPESLERIRGNARRIAVLIQERKLPRMKERQGLA